MSTIHANTCIQTTTPLHNRWWFWWQCPVLEYMHSNDYATAQSLQLHFLEPGVKVNGDHYWNTVLLNMLLLDIRSVFGDYYVYQQDGAPAHRAHDTLTMLQRETPEFIPPEMDHLIRQIWIRWTTASGVCFKRGSTARRSMIWVEGTLKVERTSAEGVEAAAPCTPSSRQWLRSGIVVWMHVFAWMVDILNTNFELLTFCCVLFVSSILVSVNVIDMNMCIVQSANIGVKCVTFVSETFTRYGSNITNVWW